MRHNYTQKSALWKSEQDMKEQSLSAFLFLCFNQSQQQTESTLCTASPKGVAVSKMSGGGWEEMVGVMLEKQSVSDDNGTGNNSTKPIPSGGKNTFWTSYLCVLKMNTHCYLCVLKKNEHCYL